MDKLTPSYKRNTLFQAFRERIQAGGWAPGEKLPGCRELAASSGVSYVTVCKAMQALVRAGLVQSIRGHGSYVAGERSASSIPRCIKLMSRSEAGSDIIDQLHFWGLKLFEEAGWTTRIVITQNLEEALDALKEPGWCHLLYGYGFSFESQLVAMIQRLGIQSRVVILATQVEKFGIGSVSADEGAIIDLSLRHLRQRHHRKIGLLLFNNHIAVEKARRDAWLRHYPDPAFQNQAIIYLNTPPEPTHRTIIDAVNGFYQRSGFLQRIRGLDGLICPDPIIAALTSRFLQIAGLRIPQDISIVSINDADFLKACLPTISVVESTIKDHVAAALFMLEHPEAPRMYRCPPNWIQRES